MQKVRLAAVDIGNDAVKAFNGTNLIYIPNVIAEIGASRDYVELEKNMLDGLHVEITSSALKKEKGCYAVGNLATGYPNNDELTSDSEKSNNDQSLILLLTTLAYDAVLNFPEKNGLIEAHYHLSTGLPLDEAKQKGKRKEFKEKLKSATHIVRFLDVPEVAGKEVQITLEEVLVNTEGHAAMIDLTTNDNGSIKNEDLIKITSLIHDIGGLSTDSAIINPDGSVDNLHSEGINEGVSPYLDDIIKRVERKFGYRFRSRRQLVETIIHPDAEERGVIWVKGRRESIQFIVDEVLMTLAKEEYKLIRKMWNQVPHIRVAYLIGGGSVILKPYIEKLNGQEEKFPLRFVKPEESVWMICKAYFKLLRMYLNRKRSA
ncbi:ParM/StbA family protein [Neobacillus paridis]|uniref:ParM/StbA family protein n=1 Tax=Neobacillus paridis TaxID=2803862 RepID=UPI001F1C0920|nr:ParM/StbA family protein [Neobacillus paridis]